MEERNSTISLSRVQSRTCSGYAEAGNGRKKFKINLLPEFMFIVLEGLDGAGKSTQIRMLQELFARRGVECRYLHFPRFDAPVFGDLIARFLRGELGTVEAVSYTHLDVYKRQGQGIHSTMPVSGCVRRHSAKAS